MRSFIIDDERALPQSVQEPDRVVDAGGALVFEGAGYLHVTNLTSVAGN
jgi:hypothetical protein